ncbi:MAG TPA: phosphatidate cytidylyltransferase [Terriglobales bacterium]|nr:phosphatidate cytidylyltransferase [Terriglobales bacterium]
MELLKRVLTAVVLIPIVLLLVLRAPVPVLAFVAGVVALLAIHELLKLAESYNIRPLYKPVYVFVALFFLLIAIPPEASSTPALSTSGFAFVAVCFAGFAPFIFLVIAMRRDELSSSFPAAVVAAFAFAYIALPMASLVQLREQWQGSFFLLYLLLLVWAGDIFAYFIGKSLGTHRMSPRVSPKKTWEGAVASVVASVAVGMLMTHYAVPISRALLHARLIEQRDGVFTEPAMFPIIILSIVLNVAAQLGDLVESVIKRGAGVKDSGAILPGHGGMFDRIDALLFAAPVLWAYMAWRVLLQ